MRTGVQTARKRSRRSTTWKIIGKMYTEHLWMLRSTMKHKVAKKFENKSNYFKETIENFFNWKFKLLNTNMQLVLYHVQLNPLLYNLLISIVYSLDDSPGWTKVSTRFLQNIHFSLTSVLTKLIRQQWKIRENWRASFYSQINSAARRFLFVEKQNILPNISGNISSKLNSAWFIILFFQVLTKKNAPQAR